jgi:SAM-dependent methyltransferase
VILGALGGAGTVVNIGAGAGAYEPSDRTVVAVEPSRRMIEQRPAGAHGTIQASAEALPFRSGAFDAALAVLTLHHWSDWRRGLDEMRRVAERIVILTFDLEDLGGFWLTQRYFPELVERSRGLCPPVDEVAAHLGQCRVESVGVPHDCVDGFLAAYWRRPEAYLDPKVRAGMSGFALLSGDAMSRGLTRLRADLESGEWERRFGHLRRLEAIDVCYRLLVTV